MKWKGVSKHLLDRSKNHESAMLPQYSDLQQYAGPPKHLHEVLRCTMLDSPLSLRSLGVKSGSTNYKGRRISGYETAYNITLRDAQALQLCMAIME
jgi:hypothetical protein